MNPMDDIAKLGLLMNIDQRFMAAMPKIMPGQASEEVIQEFKGIIEGYEKLLNAGPPEYPFYKLDDVRSKIAEAMEYIARSYDSLRNIEQAKLYYERAAQAFEEIGQQEKAKRCRINIVRIKASDEGTIDDEIKRLQVALEKLPKDPLQHVETLIEIGELYSKNGDDFEAEKYLKEAERECERMGYANPPSGENLAAALEKTLINIKSNQGSSGPSQIETLTQVRNLYRRLYLTLVRIYREIDAEKAAKYEKLIEQMDSSELRQSFSEKMLKSLPDLLGKFFKGDQE